MSIRRQNELLIEFAQKIKLKWLSNTKYFFEPKTVNFTGWTFVFVFIFEATITWHNCGKNIDEEYDNNIFNPIKGKKECCWEAGRYQGTHTQILTELQRLTGESQNLSVNIKATEDRTLLIGKFYCTDGRRGGLVYVQKQPTTGMLKLNFLIIFCKEFKQALHEIFKWIDLQEYVYKGWQI